jgi:hypothetical protein
VLDPYINECVLENPLELCPDGSIPQPTSPGGTQPECPSFEAEQPGAGPVAEEEQEESAPEEEQQGDGSHHQKMIVTTTTTRLVCQFTNLLAAANRQLR